MWSQASNFCVSYSKCWHFHPGFLQVTLAILGWSQAVSCCCASWRRIQLDWRGILPGPLVREVAVKFTTWYIYICVRCFELGLKIIQDVSSNSNGTTSSKNGGCKWRSDCEGVGTTSSWLRRGKWNSCHSGGSRRGAYFHSRWCMMVISYHISPLLVVYVTIINFI